MTILKAIDVAQSILHIANTSGDIVTNLKLQKLLYYAQAWYLVNFNEPLFVDDIEAWQYGPVVKDVYQEFKKYQNKPIDKYDKKAINKLSNSQFAYLKEFCTYFMRFSATELVSMTHNELPWKEAYERAPKTIISIDSMKNFYSSLINDTTV